jgi:hypothetical protein
MKSVAPEHNLTGGLGRLTVDAGYPTIALGRDQTGALVQVSMFRPQPTTVAFIGGRWGARTLVFRGLGMGAVAPVRVNGAGVASVPQWTELDHFAAGGGRRVWQVHDERQSLPPGMSWLVLHVFDVGPAGPAARPALGPWQTQLTIVGQPDQTSLSVISSAHILLCQRLDRREAELVAAVRGRGQATAQLLTALDNGMVAALAGGVDRPFWWSPTSLERRLFGDPAVQRAVTQ